MDTAFRERESLLSLDGDLTGIDREALEEEIREEAYRIYERRAAAGCYRAPQDDWVDAINAVLTRHGLAGYRAQWSGELR